MDEGDARIEGGGRGRGNSSSSGRKASVPKPPDQHNTDEPEDGKPRAA